MAQQTINVGTAPNDGTGTPLRTAFQYTNSNFSELYTAVGPSGNNIVVPGNATITGDLTVDTSTLKVDSANNRVGIGTASPGLALDIVGSARVTYGQSYNSFTSGGSNSPMLSCQIWNAVGNIVVLQNPYSDVVIGSSTTGTSTERYRIASDGVATWSNVGGVAGTVMTLNSTGLGVGLTPAAGDGSGVFKAAGTGSGATNTRIGLDVREITSGNAAGIWLGAMNSENTGVIGSRTASGNIAFQTFNGASWGERMRIDYLGNVGIGITSPSYLLHTSVPTGGDRNMVRFQVSGASSGLTITWNNGTQKMRVNFGDLPTSSAGLPANTLWVDTAAGNTLKLA